MGTVNPGRVNVVTTPWSNNWLTHADAAAALTDLGVSPYMAPAVNDADLTTLLTTLGVGGPAKAMADDADNAAVAATLQQDQLFDVRWYGAVGDGVTDDSAAIRAAIVAAGTAGGGIVFFPRPTAFYSLAADITIDANNLHLLGVPGTRLHREIGASNAACLSGVEFNDVTIEGLTFTTEATYGGAASQNCLYFIGVASADIQRLKVLRCTFDGCSRGIYAASVEDLLVDGCAFFNCLQGDALDWGYGLLVNNSSGVRLVNNYLAATVRRHAYYLTDSSRIVVANSTIYSSVDPAFMPSGNERPLKVFNCDDVTIQGNSFIGGGNSLCAIQIDDTNTRIAIVANTFADCDGLVHIFSTGTVDSLSIVGNVGKFLTATADTGAIRLDSTTPGRCIVAGNALKVGDNNVLRTGGTGWDLVIQGNEMSRTGAGLTKYAVRTGDSDIVMLTGNRIDNFGSAIRRGLALISANYVTNVTYQVEVPAVGSVVAGDSRGDQLPELAYTANDTLTAGMTGRTITNTGATGTVTLTLPGAYIGRRVTFSRTEAFALRVDPAGTNYIMGGTGAGKYAELGSLGASLTIECRTTGVWLIVASHGTVTFE
jgi:hypothetical protein